MRKSVWRLVDGFSSRGYTNELHCSIDIPKGHVVWLFWTHLNVIGSDMGLLYHYIQPCTYKHVQFPKDRPGKKLRLPPKVWALGVDKSHTNHHLKSHLEIIWDLPEFVTPTFATRLYLDPRVFATKHRYCGAICACVKTPVTWKFHSQPGKLRNCPRLQKHWKVVFPSAEAGKPSSSPEWTVDYRKLW